MNKTKFLILLIVLIQFEGTCSKRKKNPTGPSVVHFHKEIPKFCSTTMGLKQKKVIPVFSEKEMQEHYGITFLVRFNDDNSDSLYGVLYYQNQRKNIYCMALPNGTFASFSDSSIGQRKNIIQEICYPLHECEW